MEYLYLFGSLLSGTTSNILLKYSDGYKKILPSIGNLILYFAATWLLSLAVTKINLGLAYATWSGLGIIIAAVAGKLLFQETPSKTSILGMGIVIIGVIILNVC